MFGLKGTEECIDPHCWAGSLRTVLPQQMQWETHAMGFLPVSGRLLWKEGVSGMLQVYH